MAHNEIVRKTSVIITLNTVGIELFRVLSHQNCNMSLEFRLLELKIHIVKSNEGCLLIFSGKLRSSPERGVFT